MSSAHWDTLWQHKKWIPFLFLSYRGKIISMCGGGAIPESETLSVRKDQESISQAQQCGRYVDINKHSFIPFPMCKKKKKPSPCMYVCMDVCMYICIIKAFNLQPMMCVHHGSHPIKSETIKLVLLHPPPQIGEQKSQYLQKKFTSAINT
jgi:hypothetical protein